MFFSIIIPLFNGQEYIERSVRSVAEQQCDKPFEVIIVDDGSTDDSLTRAKLLSKQFNHCRVISKSNGGAASARNTGVDVAKGEWIAFLDCDDIMLPNSLNLRARAIQHLPRTKLFSGRQIIQKRNGETFDILDGTSWSYLSDIPDLITNIEGFMPKLIQDTVLYSTNTVTAKKEQLQSLGGFDESLHRGEDHDLWLRLSVKNTAIGFINQPLSKYIIRQGSLSQVPEPDEVYIIKFVNKLISSPEFQPYKSNFKAKLFLAYRNAIWHYRHHKNYKVARRLAFKMWLSNPYSIYAMKMFIASFLMF